MRRRMLFRAGLIGSVGLIASAAEAETPRRADKVVYHLSDVDKAAFVVATVLDHYADLGRIERMDYRIAVVVAGPAIASFRREYPFVALDEGTRDAAAHGVEFWACPNALVAARLNADDLLPPFRVSPRLGVSFIADLQAAGWLYLRP